MPVLPPVDAALSLVPPFLGHLSSDRLSNRLSKPSERTGGPRQAGLEIWVESDGFPRRKAALAA
jgi:hypothetical protein